MATFYEDEKGNKIPVEERIKQLAKAAEQAREEAARQRASTARKLRRGVRQNAQT